MEKRTMADAIEHLVESPAWGLMDERHKKMAREIERLTRAHLVVEERSWQNWLAWLDGTLGSVPVRDEVDLAPLYDVVQHGYVKAKLESSTDDHSAAGDASRELVPKTREEMRALFG